MNSLDGIEEARPPKDGLLKVKEKIDQQKSKNLTKQPSQWMAVAAVILLLFCANIFVVSDYFKYQENAEQVSTSYSGMISNFNIYE